MSLVLVSQKPTTAPQPLIEVTTADGRTWLVPEPKQPPATGSIGASSDSEFAQEIWSGVYGKEDAPNPIGTADESAEVYSGVGLGDTSSVSVVCGQKLVPGGSSHGPLVLTAKKELAALLSTHASANVGKSGITEGEYRAFSPCDIHRGSLEQNAIGTVHSFPISLNGDVGEVDLALLHYEKDFGEKLRSRKKRVLVESTLWSGCLPKRPKEIVYADVPRFRVKKYPKGKITAGWVRDRLNDEGRVSGLGSTREYFPHNSKVDLADAFPDTPMDANDPRGLFIEARAWNGKLLIFVVGVLGQVSGKHPLTKADLGRQLFACGQRSRLTEGTLYGVDAMIHSIKINDEVSAAFKGWFLVREKNPGEPFSRPGDSNTSIYARDKKFPYKLLVTGMVDGGADVRFKEPNKDGSREIVTLAQPIEKCLDVSDTTLYVGE